MTATLEDRIRQVFGTDAAQAPVTNQAWDGPTVGVTVRPRSRRQPSRRFAAVAAAIVAIVAAGYLVTRLDLDSPAIAWRPAGVEYSIADLGPATSSRHQTIAELSRMVQVPGQPVITVVRTVEYFVGVTAEELRCEDSGGGGVCAPDWSWVRTPDVSVGSSVDNHLADENVWMWDGLPAGTTYVEYVDGDRHLWQRPIAGFSAFPDVAGGNEIATAFAADGTVLGRAGAGTTDPPSAGSGKMPRRADVDKSQEAELENLTSVTMRDCLTAAGATWGSANVATFAAGVDYESRWAECVTHTKQVVGARVSEMGVRTYDPVTEYPADPNSPISPVFPADCKIAATAPGISNCSVTGP